MTSKQEWKKTKLKYLANFRSGETITSDTIEPLGEYPVYGGGALRGYTSKFTHNGQYILIGRQGANCGAVRDVSGKLWASEHAVVVTPNLTTDGKWLRYALESMNLNQYSISAAQPGLAVSTIKDLELRCPAIEVQQSISSYIGTRASQIEHLILKKEELITLLEEKRQAVITEAVTKGLNPDVKMKDSGVEWIGEIPEHWEVERMKFVSNINPGKSEINKDKDIDVTFIPMENVVSAGVVDISITKHLSEVYSGYTYFQNKDIVIAKVTPCFENGNIAVVENLKNGIGFGTTEFHVLRIKKNHNVKYFYYFVQSERFKQEAVSEMYGVGGLKRIPSDYITNYKLALPRLEEQEVISSFLDEITMKVANSISLIRTQIQKLKEYRQSLIYEAVTGKIDVRDYVETKL